MEEARQEKFSRICRQFKWKCTAQRLAVYEAICGNRCHPDVDSVLESVRAKLPTVTRESVYRILNEFAGQNLIWRLDHVSSARYDSNPMPHGHFICENCGTIADFAWQKDLADFSGTIPGEVWHMEIRVTGLCGNCKQDQVSVK